MATYNNDLRLKEIATGDESGAWGTSTNTNLQLITDAFGYGTKAIPTDADTTFTMPDATADGVRAFYLKITSSVSLTATRTVTLGPNTISKVWTIENATTGGQSIVISQGSGSTVTVTSGAKVMVYTDGAGATAAVSNANPTAAAGGDVVGPASSTDNAITRFDLTTGKLIQNSSSFVADTGAIGIGTSTLTGYSLRSTMSLTSATSFGAALENALSSAVTTAAYGFRTGFSTQAAAFTLPNAYLFNAEGVTVGAGSTVTNQFGFIVGSSMTGATNNYGFYGNIAAGTGRWNLYMTGTADNYLGGALGIGTTTLTGYVLHVGKTITGATSSFGINVDGTIQSDVTSVGTYFRTTATTQATAFTLSDLIHYRSVQGTLGAGSTVTSQYGFYVDATLTGATNNYGFYGNIAAGTNRWNLYMNGTAENYLAGNLKVGATTARGTTAGTNHVSLFDGTAPAGTLTNGVTLYSASGDFNFMDSAGSGYKVGFRNIPQNAQTGSYTLVLADAGKHIYHASGAGAATYTIPANGSVAYDIGTAITFVNLSATSISIAITTDTMYLSSAGTTGTRTLAQYGSATAIKVTSTAWLISGSGLT